MQYLSQWVIKKIVMNAHDGILSHKFLWLLGFSILALSSALYGIWIYPLQQHHDLSRIKMIQLQQQLAFVQQQSAKADVLQQRMQLLHQKYRKLQTLFPGEKNISNVLETLTQKGIEHQLLFQAMTPMPPEASEFYRVFPVQIVMIGNYSQVVAFLSFMIRHHRYLYWKTLDIRRLFSHESSEEQLKVRMILYVYSLLDNE